jgi:hypothetical protein
LIISIHQPHFLPWLGYFNKVLHSDVFVWLHTVQFRRRYFQNRAQLRHNVTDQPFWLTLAVHAGRQTRIDEVELADPRWREKVRKTIELCYGRAPCFDDCWPPIEAALERSSDCLDDVNYQTFSAVLEMLGADALRIERAGDLVTSSADADATERLLEICLAVGATGYIAGEGGRNYMRTDLFEQRGVKILWQHYDPLTVSYPQPGNGFLPGLSVVDCLFNVGAARTRDLALQAWSP